MLNSLNEVRLLDKNKILGEGAYSEVLKVQYQKDQKLYALKQIDISHLSKEDCNNLKNEMKLHKKLNHTNIIQFYDALQIKHMVYFLLEYACNGCLFFYIHSKKGLPERLALRFLYQTALAVKYLHENQCLHRDIKPENILLDENFNVKLCDFGWSCKLEDKKPRKSICGTYEYMPPEVLKKNAQNEKVDIWCLGIMLYEMLHGKTPFNAEGLDEIKEQLEQKQIMVKESISINSKDLLKNLLRKNESERFNIDQVLNHQSFNDIKKTIDLKIPEDDFNILMDYYLVNVRSQKRHLPESIERNIQQQEENQINRNLIKEIKESFFQNANNVEGFFDSLPDTKNSIKATQDFFELSNKDIDKISIKKSMDKFEQNKFIEQTQSLQDNINLNKNIQNLNAIQSYNQVNQIQHDQQLNNSTLNFSKLYQNIQQKNSNKKSNDSNNNKFVNKDSLNLYYKKDHVFQKKVNENLDDNYKNFNKQNSDNTRNKTQQNKKIFQSSRFQKKNPMTFLNFQNKTYSRQNSQNQQSTSKSSNKVRIKLDNNKNIINPLQKIQEQNQQKDQQQISQRNIHNQSFNNQNNISINSNNMSFQQAPKLSYELSPQITKQPQKISVPNNFTQSQNHPLSNRNKIQGHSKSFFGAYNYQNKFSKGLQVPINNKQTMTQIQEQKSQSFYNPKSINTKSEEQELLDKNYQNMNFINASYRNIQIQNQAQKIESKSLSKQINNQKQKQEEKKSLPSNINDNNKIQSYKIAPATHKYIMKNGQLQKMELTEQDYREHGPKIIKNYSGYLYQKQIRSFSTDVTKKKQLLPKSKQISNFNLDLKSKQFLKNKPLQQQKSLTNRPNLNQDLTLFTDQNFRRNITIIKKQTYEQKSIQLTFYYIDYQVQKQQT